MSTTTTNREAEDYLDAVRRALADLPEEERGELLEDLAQHLTDIATDESRADVPLVDLLGSPTDYASELRTAAGLPSASSRRLPPMPRPDLRAWLNNSSLGRWANGPTGQRVIGPVVSFARELIPAWWVARAVIAVVGFFLIASGPGEAWRHLPLPQVLGSRLVGLLLIGGAVLLSIRLGRRGYAGRRRLVLAADVVVALVALSLVMDASARLGSFPFGSTRVVYADPSSDQYVLSSPHGPVTNIYPYDSQGRALENVLLFDQDGRPLRVARQEWWADGCQRTPTHPLAADGVPVEFSYPVKYAVDLQPFMSLDPETRTYMEHTVAQNCQQQIPRPNVPLPVLPPEVTTEVAPEGQTETPPEDAPQTAP